MKSAGYILIISEKNECSEVIKHVGAKSVGHSNIFRVDEPSAGIALLNKMGLVDNKIPACIFLSTDVEREKIKAFLNLLDRDYPFASRGKVVLVDSDYQLNNLMGLAISDSVGQFINCPVLPIEVETVLNQSNMPLGMLA
jgi:hypothetical protein